MSHGMVLDPDGRSSSPCFPDQRRSRYTPRPRRGRGVGGKGADRQPPPSGPRGRAHRRAARGGAAPPNEGRGRTTAPGPSGGSPTRRAAPGRRKPHHPNPTKNLVLLDPGGRNARTQQNLFSCWVRSVVAAAELWRRIAPLQFPGKVLGNGFWGRSTWGGTTTPPQGVTRDK